MSQSFANTDDHDTYLYADIICPCNEIFWPSSYVNLPFTCV